MKQQIYKILLLSFIALVLSAGQVFAAENQTSTANNNCNLQDNLDKLVAIKDNNDLSQEDKDKTELSIRKDLYIQILTCSGAEAKNVKKDLENIKDLNETDGKIKDKFLSDLDGFIAYYENQNKKVVDDLSLDDVKKMAQETSDWRDKNYNSEIKSIMNFSLIFSEKEMITTADNRFQKISLALKVTGLGNNNKIKKLLNQAGDNLAQAKKLHGEAYKSFVYSLVDQSADNSKNSKTESVNKKSQDEIKGMLKTSLDKLKDSYQKFFEMSKEIQKILG